MKTQNQHSDTPDAPTCLKPLLVAVLFSFIACKKDISIKYPIYSKTQVIYIPDSLKVKHREWIKETIRASNQHLFAGDYEDIDETIIQVEKTADRIFEIKTFGLRKKFSDKTFDYLDYIPNELNTYEKQILDSLVNSH